MKFHTNKRYRFSRLALILLSMTALTAGCGGGGGGGETPPAGDTTNPTAIVSPASTSTLGSNTPIVITFSETIDTSTLVLGGTMNSEGDGGAWSQASVTNDTLTVSPATAWGNGPATLTVDAKDMAGNSLTTLNLSYTVDATLPTGITAPTSGATINSSQQIVVTFSEGMDSLTRLLGGTMVSDSDGGVWTTTNFPDDTLTISPSANWSGGAQTLTIDADDPQGNPVSRISLSYTVDVTAPTGSESPTYGTSISTSGQVVITFSESMDTATLVLGASMADEDDGGVWSQTSFPNDTLTISPASTWTAGNAYLSIDADDLAGNSLSTINLYYDVDQTAPSVNSTFPVNGASLPKTETIIIKFSESMDTASLSLGGTLILDNYSTSWSQQATPNDTLNVTPKTLWSQYPTITLTVDADDIFGNSLTPLNLNFTLEPEVYYVKGTGDDANNGWRTSPKKTIQGAIDSATAPAEIRVAQGVYSENVTLKEGVSLKGGYEAISMLSRDPLANPPSTIQDPSSSGGSSGNPTWAVYGGSGIASDTVVDGFTIKGGTGSYTSGLLLVSASPTVSNNKIYGGTGTTESYGIYNSGGASPAITDNTLITGQGGGAGSNGIYNTGSSPTISGNDIRGGTATNSSTGVENVSSSALISGNIIDGGTGASYSYGIRNTSSSGATIESNTIDGGDSTSGSSTGLHIGASSAIVYNNTVFGGTGDDSRGITTTVSSATIRNNTVNGGSGATSSHAMYLYSDSTVAIVNNILFNSGSGTAYCIYESQVGADPAYVANNNFYPCGTGLYYDDWSTPVNDLSTTVTTGEGSISLLARQNVAVDPLFTDIDGAGNDINNMTDNDWSLSASSSASDGGLDLSIYFTDDKAGTARTDPWSMGAYEY